jgi:cation diffusion facilitator CzcD-associated flavoprotein CzcO
MKKITIIGAGFAGLTAVRTLRKQDKASIPGNFLIKCPPEAIINASLST